MDDKIEEEVEVEGEVEIEPKTGPQFESKFGSGPEQPVKPMPPSGRPEHPDSVRLANLFFTYLGRALPGNAFRIFSAWIVKYARLEEIINFAFTDEKHRKNLLKPGVRHPLKYFEKMLPDLDETCPYRPQNEKELFREEAPDPQPDGLTAQARGSEAEVHVGQDGKGVWFDHDE